MLHPDVELVGLSGDELSNWWRVALPAGVWTGSWALVVRREAGAIAVVKDRGRVELGGEEIETTRTGLEKVRKRLGADFVFVVDDDALARISTIGEAKAARGRDYPEQWLAIYDALRGLRGRGIWSDPPLLDILPPLSHDALARALELLIPNHTTLVTYIFDRQGVHASAIATVEGGVIDSFAMHRAIADGVSPTALRGWKTSYKRINELVAQRFAPPAISVFTSVDTVRRILGGPSDQLTRELSKKNLIIDPMPAWLAGLVGGAAAAAIATKSAQTLSRFLPKKARMAAEAAYGVAKDRLREAGPLAVLGFDPILLWQTVQRYYHTDS